MHHSGNTARRLGYQLGSEQGKEHGWLKVQLDGTTLQAMATLCWRFERHRVANDAYLKRLFIEGYVRGYQRE
jgi:hypothetical protein